MIGFARHSQTRKEQKINCKPRSTTWRTIAFKYAITLKECTFGGAEIELCLPFYTYTLWSTGAWFGTLRQEHRAAAASRRDDYGRWGER